MAALIQSLIISCSHLIILLALLPNDPTKQQHFQPKTSTTSTHSRPLQPLTCLRENYEKLGVPQPLFDMCNNQLPNQLFPLREEFCLHSPHNNLPSVAYQIHPFSSLSPSVGLGIPCWLRTPLSPAIALPIYLKVLGPVDLIQPTSVASSHFRNLGGGSLCIS